MRKLILFVCFLGAACLIWTVLSLKPVSSDMKQRVFRVEAGQGVNAISRNLHEARLIRSSFAFETLLWLMRAESNVHAGTYILSENMNVLQVIDTLIAGKSAPGGTVTLIEGWDLKEYRDYLVKQGFSGEAFETLTKDLSVWNESYSFLRALGNGRNLEGYVFPDTYAVDPERDVKLLLRKMLDNFDTKLSQDLRDEIARQGKTVDEVVILASIIEKEVATTKDRKLVADIFLKRLKDGIALQSDATVNFITDSGRTKSTAKDLSIDSPYNTYKYRGLPPGPIGNPSLDAITSVIYPEPNPYYYFLTDPAGKVYYARNFSEHQKNKEKYL